ncbi:hypothetical protein NDI45_25215 [Leptolyngbya sp. GB1-A1]|uniref:hypothetical protein n=1 Tax=Leptolyngbya sp. GB1-A1 TaxID=2933908 RepID=UPI00329930BF
MPHKDETEYLQIQIPKSDALKYAGVTESRPIARSTHTPTFGSPGLISQRNSGDWNANQKAAAAALGTVAALFLGWQGIAAWVKHSSSEAHKQGYQAGLLQGRNEGRSENANQLQQAQAQAAAAVAQKAACDAQIAQVQALLAPVAPKP